MKEQRHTGMVRMTHWVTAVCFVALVVSGVAILISHPRFYWGEDGNVLIEPLFTLPIPASRGSVPTGYGYVLKDQNGWSRSLHIQAAWFVVITGLLYGGYGFATRHFQKNLWPVNFSVAAMADSMRAHLRRPLAEEAGSYNLLQRLAYALVVFVAFPLAIWTGLAMSPAFVAAVPVTVTALGGQQSARTIHFFVSLFLVGFLFVHIAMVVLAGFRGRMRAMIFGRQEELS